MMVSATTTTTTTTIIIIISSSSSSTHPPRAVAGVGGHTQNCGLRLAGTRRPPSWTMVVRVGAEA